MLTLRRFCSRYTMKVRTAFALVIALMNVALCEASPRVPLSERTFIFTWPTQPETDSLLESHGALITDRPSFTDASRPVGNRVTLVELGYTYSYNGATAPHTSSHSYPELALRQGLLANWLELRASQNMTSYASLGDAQTAFGNLELGTRLGITPQFGVLPELSVTPHLSLPTSSGEDRTHHSLPGVSVSYSWAFWDRYSIAGSSQIYQDENSDSDARYTEWLESAVVTWNATDTVALWGELAGFFPGSISEERDSYYANMGALYLLTQNSQLDIRVGSGLQDSFGQNIFSGVGFSIRYQ
jgi:hypothetical protein